MQLIQIGQQKAAPNVTIREMFEKLAQKEADAIREAKARALGFSVRTNS